MLPLFRKTRWRLAADSQFFKYSRYAIGEIVLVVIGILIALYINNWNEERKDSIKKGHYVQKLISDLKKDSIALSSFVNWVNLETNNLKQINELLDRPDTEITIDSIIDISTRINYLNPGSPTFNDETFQTLISTGEIRLLSESQMEQLMILHKRYEEHIKMTDVNSEMIIRSLEDYLNDFGYLNGSEKNSLYYKTLKRNFNEFEFLKKLRTYMGYKIFLYDLIASDANLVLEETIETLTILEKTDQN